MIRICRNRLRLAGTTKQIVTDYSSNFDLRVSFLQRPGSVCNSQMGLHCEFMTVSSLSNKFNGLRGPAFTAKPQRPSRAATGLRVSAYKVTFVTPTGRHTIDDVAGNVKALFLRIAVLIGWQDLPRVCLRLCARVMWFPHQLSSMLDPYETNLVSRLVLPPMPCCIVFCLYSPPYSHLKNSRWYVVACLHVEV